VSHDMTGITAGQVVVAPDKFRGSLTSPEVAAHVAAGLRSAGSGQVLVVRLPVADGGVGFGALAFLEAKIRPGIGYLLDLVDFDRHVEGARLVITGEGSIDGQTLRGKAPVGVAAAAAKHGVPVVAVCGRRSVGDEELRAVGIEAAYALTDVEPDVRRCMAEAGPLLERLAGQIAAAFIAT
jgi:glycerate 2-kinase